MRVGTRKHLEQLLYEEMLCGISETLDRPSMGKVRTREHQNDRSRIVASASALAKGSCAKIRGVMSVLFNHACRYELFDRNPIQLVRQGAKRKKTPCVLTPAEIRVLSDGLAIRERTLVLLAASTGLRQSELF